jgi:acyl carrier protein
MNTIRIKQVIAKTLLLNEDNIENDDAIGTDLGADSLDVVSLIMGLESEFNINIPDEDAEKLLTVNDIITYINKRVPSKG